MDKTLTLVKAITLLFIENYYFGATNDTTAPAINEALTIIPTPDANIDPIGKSIITALKTTLAWMMGHPASERFDRYDLLQRLRVNAFEDTAVYDALCDGIMAERDTDSAKKTASYLLREIRDYINQVNVKKIIQSAARKLDLNNAVDWRHFVKEIRTDLKPYSNMSAKAINKAIIDDFDFNNPSSMSLSIERRLSELSTDGVLRFGIQAINRMFGKAGGARRGEFCTFGALQHNFKSGMLLTLMKQVALYNSPFMRDPSKKPMLLRITFENDASDDVLWLYKSLVENETGVDVDVKAVPYEEAVKYVTERLQATGYTIKIVRIDPTDFTIHDLCDYINELEQDGYEIHAAFLDYLNMMTKKGCDPGPHGHDIRDLYRRARNFFSKKGITLFTVHQLSSDAKNLVRQGAENFVQEIANKGYWDGCKAIDQELDFEMYIHIVKVNGKSYLTCQRGKHRGINITPIVDQYTVLQFFPVGGIKDDVNGPDLSLRFVGGTPLSEGGDAAWWS